MIEIDQRGGIDCSLTDKQATGELVPLRDLVHRCPIRTDVVRRGDRSGDDFDALTTADLDSQPAGVSNRVGPRQPKCPTLDRRAQDRRRCELKQP